MDRLNNQRHYEHLCRVLLLVAHDGFYVCAKFDLVVVQLLVCVELVGGHRPVVGQKQHAIKADRQNEAAHCQQILLVRHLPSKLKAHEKTNGHHDQNVESEVKGP